MDKEGIQIVQLEFIPIDDFAKDYLESFKPASRYVPGWYREMPRHRFGDSGYGIALNNDTISNATLKGCTPFLDALTYGYMAVAPVDFEVRKIEGEEFVIRWRTDGDFIGRHDQSQYPDMQRESKSSVLEWESYFITKTPKGYSTMFTHPFNRHDLPFRTFTGIVDTDKYYLPALLPFEITANIEPEEFFIIEKGTPLYQFFPIKRESWSSKTVEIDDKKRRKEYFDMKSKIKNSYKDKYWQRKSFS